MRCYNCGCDLSENDFCTACGADVSLYKKIIRLSNRYYNEGLARAKVRDLSGAAESLRQSLKCNKYNTEARNLLGLVYFEMGEAVDAISEWVISKNFQPKKNVADDFLNSVQSNPSKWDAIRQTTKKYNLAIDYCRQDSLDLAIIQLKSLLKMNPKMLKGHLLLALLYMNDEEWDKAARCIARAKTIDANNTTALLYENEIEEAIAARNEMSPEIAAKKKKKQKIKDDIITYQSGNETIIQPLNNSERSAGLATLLNVLIGLVIGLAIMWYLVLPARIRAAQSNANSDVVEVSNQLTEKSASMDELQKRADALEAENAELMNRMASFTGSDGIMQASDILMDSARRYMEEPDDVIEIAESLSKIDEQYITGSESSDTFKSLYEMLHKEVSEKASATYMEDGLDKLKDEKYAEAIEVLTKACDLDGTNVEALYNLGHAYRRNDQISKANEVYRRVMKDFPESEFAKKAKEYVEEGNDSALENNDDEAGNGDDDQAALPELSSPVPAQDIPVLPILPDAPVDGTGAADGTAVQ